jgi:hypothetical protein
MDEAAVQQAPHILAGGNDRAAPLTDLARSTEFIVFGIEIEALAGLYFVLANLALTPVLRRWRGWGLALDTRLVSTQKFFFTIFRCDSHAEAFRIRDRDDTSPRRGGCSRTLISAEHQCGRPGSRRRRAVTRRVLGVDRRRTCPDFTGPSVHRKEEW